jgi:hypothetical protein
MKWSLFSHRKQIIDGNKAAYEKALRHYAQNPDHTYLRQLTIEEGKIITALCAKGRRLRKMTGKTSKKILKMHLKVKSFLPSGDR